MADIRAIDGGKAKRAKTLAEARILECECGSREFIRTETGVLIGKDGKEVFSGTKGRKCARCGRAVE